MAFPDLKQFSFKYSLILSHLIWGSLERMKSRWGFHNAELKDVEVLRMILLLELLQLLTYIVGADIMDKGQMDNHPDSVKVKCSLALSYDEQSKHCK